MKLLGRARAIEAPLVDLRLDRLVLGLEAFPMSERLVPHALVALLLRGELCTHRVDQGFPLPP